MVAEPRTLSRIWEGAINLLYPTQCRGCGAAISGSGALCPTCWADAEFIAENQCHGCGVPLPAAVDDDGACGAPFCDVCITTQRPWQAARAAMVYRGVGRRLVLALKHGDRADLAVVLGRWLADAAAPLVEPDMAVAPVPLHPRRLLRRRYNQAALLAGHVARHHRLALLPGALIRRRHTPMQDHRSMAERFANQRDAIAVSSRMLARIRGRPILLVDDVMASGATVAAATDALLAAGCGPISVAVLARSVRDA